MCRKHIVTKNVVLSRYDKRKIKIVYKKNNWLFDVKRSTVLELITIETFFKNISADLLYESR